ncbi:hypothetical protein [Plantibacter sp. ME-Dv--P-122b]|uniref:hypothetical protein n=1 Tax=Plantibacter sp. ME-Dv--P-122b TaxID=3040300 RepID=UPI00255188DE|nr:hypothetical protein [Plantibacter sp. ME-Dv--P-122b]
MGVRRRIAGIAIIVGITIGASACTGPSPDDPDTTRAPVPTETFVTKPPQETPTPLPVEAVMVIASVDMDGANVSVSGYVAGVIEEAGSCEYLLSNGTDEVRVPSTGSADRAQTSCGVVQVPINQVSRGSWTVALEYSSPTTPKVVSSPLTVEIP